MYHLQYDLILHEFPTRCTHTGNYAMDNTQCNITEDATLQQQRHKNLKSQKSGTSLKIQFVWDVMPYKELRTLQRIVVEDALECLTPKVKALRSFETSVNIYPTHSVTSQKTWIFNNTAVSSSKLARYVQCPRIIRCLWLALMTLLASQAQWTSNGTKDGQCSGHNDLI